MPGVRSKRGPVHVERRGGEGQIAARARVRATCPSASRSVLNTIEPQPLRTTSAAGQRPPVRRTNHGHASLTRIGDRLLNGTGRSRPRWPAPFVEPGAVFAHSGSGRAAAGALRRTSGAEASSGRSCCRRRFYVLSCQVIPYIVSQLVRGSEHERGRRGRDVSA